MRAFGFVACLFVLLSIVCVVDAAETVAGKSLKQWSADLQSENQTTRLRAAKTLGIFGESAGDVFNQMLDHDDVSVEVVIRVLMANAEKGRILLKELAPRLANRTESCHAGCQTALDTALITAPDARDPTVMARLDAVAGRVLRG